ncbi:MAG: hypothetical protein ACLUQE_11385, partial [Dorea formicigenerans]
DVIMDMVLIHMGADNKGMIYIFFSLPVIYSFHHAPINPLFSLIQVSLIYCIIRGRGFVPDLFFLAS